MSQTETPDHTTESTEIIDEREGWRQPRRAVFGRINALLVDERFIDKYAASGGWAWLEVEGYDITLCRSRMPWGKTAQGNPVLYTGSVGSLGIITPDGSLKEYSLTHLLLMLGLDGLEKLADTLERLSKEGLI